MLCFHRDTESVEDTIISKNQLPLNHSLRSQAPYINNLCCLINEYILIKWVKSTILSYALVRGKFFFFYCI